MATSPLSGREILLGITGGIAACRAAEVLSLLRDAGAHATVAMTEGARAFVTPLAFEALTGRAVATSPLELSEHKPSHVLAGSRADAIVVAPASAAFLGRLAAGIPSDAVTLAILCSRAPLILAPAMHTRMWEHEAVRENVRRLAARGAILVGPVLGRLATGEEGVGRMAEPTDIVKAIEKAISRPVSSR